MSTKPLELHPLCAAFPRMKTPELAELTEDIEKNGQREPIVLFEGKILEGGNRYQACVNAGKKPIVRTFGSLGTDGKSPTAYVVSMNLKRRNLTQSQKATLAVEMIPYFEAEARETGAGGDTLQKAADAAGTNRTYVADANKLKADAPETFAEVAAGEITIPAAKAAAEQKAAKEQAAADAKAIRDFRAANFEKEFNTHGDPWAAAYKSGVVLKTLRELQAWAALSVPEQISIRALIDKQWSVKNALKFVQGTLSEEDTLGNLIMRTIAAGKPLKLTIEGWAITCRKAVDGEKE